MGCQVSSSYRRYEVSPWMTETKMRRRMALNRMHKIKLIMVKAFKVAARQTTITTLMHLII